MRARNLKKGMLVRPRTGYIFVVREFEYAIPGVEPGELGFTAMKPSHGYFVRMATSNRRSSPSRVYDEKSPIMYFDTKKIKKGKKAFSKHIFLAGTDLVYLRSNSCRDLEPV